MLRMTLDTVVTSRATKLIASSRKERMPCRSANLRSSSWVAQPDDQTLDLWRDSQELVDADSLLVTSATAEVKPPPRTNSVFSGPPLSS